MSKNPIPLTGLQRQAVHKAARAGKTVRVKSGAPEMLPVYDEQGNLVGLVDPKKVRPLAKPGDTVQKGRTRPQYEDLVARMAPNLHAQWNREVLAAGSVLRKAIGPTAGMPQAVEAAKTVAADVISRRGRPEDLRAACEAVAAARTPKPAAPRRFTPRPAPADTFHDLRTGQLMRRAIPGKVW